MAAPIRLCLVKRLFLTRVLDRHTAPVMLGIASIPIVFDLETAKSFNALEERDL